MSQSLSRVTTGEIENLLQAEEGCSSANFEIEGDLSDGDCSRLTQGLVEVRQLMQRDGLNFDEARLQIVKKRMALMDVDSSGMPNDPKTFTFDQVDSMPKPWRHSGAASSSQRQLGSRRGAPTSATGFPLPKLFSGSAPNGVDIDFAGTPAGHRQLWSLWAASCKAVKPFIRGNWTTLQGLVLFGIALVVFFVRLIGWKSDSVLPSMLVQNDARPSFSNQQMFQNSVLEDMPQPP
mmetsp:Transcript_63475/g.112883  ORF Transcript_63475/g.112883 Transcript_63475/m.112883 type:complete len:235 (-) Transcript_63475:117-821(-)